MNQKKQPLKKLKTPTARRVSLPLACYVAALAVWVLLGGWHLASDALSGLTETQLSVGDFQLVQLEEAGGAGVLQTTGGDPQLLLEDVNGQTVRTVNYAAEFAGGEPREMCLYYTTRPGEPYSQDRRVFPTVMPDGSYQYQLPRGRIVSLRIDPCSPDEGRTLTVAFATGTITLNRAVYLPSGLDYWVPSWYQCFCLVLYPALAAAFLSWGVAVWRRLRPRA